MGVHVVARRPSRDEGTECWQFCSGLPVDPADLKQKIGVNESAYAHIMGRAAYEGMAAALPPTSATGPSGCATAHADRA